MALGSLDIYNGAYDKFDQIFATFEKCLFVGHSHIPIALQLCDGNLAGGLARGGSDLELGEGRWLLNPGSVGQPRDGNPAASYVMLDTERRELTYCRAPYDIEQAAAQIRKKGLPTWLADRLFVGT